MIRKEQKIKRECYEKDGVCHIPLQNGEEAICDIKFINEVNKRSWCIREGRVVSGINGTVISLHKLIFCLENKININEFFEIIHLNGNKLDNRISNLAKNERNCYVGEDGYCHIPLQNGEEAICDAKYIGEVNKFTWSFGSNRNVRTMWYGFSVQLGNFLIDIDNKNDIKKANIKFRLKYVNGNKMDNRLENLKRKPVKNCKICESHKSNKKIDYKNKIARVKNGCSSIYHGVSLINGRFLVYVKKQYVGTFKNEIDAAKSRDIFVLKNNIDLPLNFPVEIYGKRWNK